MGKSSYEIKQNKQTNPETVKELQKALKLADFYAFMLRDSIQEEVIDDQTIQCAIACVRNDCYFSECIVYSDCQMKSWRMSLLN